MKAYILSIDERSDAVVLGWHGPGMRDITLLGTSPEHARRIAQAVNTQHSTSFPAVLAAVEARGPRCERCDGWTFRPEYRHVDKAVLRLCPGCWCPPGLNTGRRKPGHWTEVILGHGPTRGTA